ncbi:MAG: orotidine-5'-phosphate decarboxylase [bacterium]|nr:orotidine-5'-phosphate decarboxylase [bacterium]
MQPHEKIIFAYDYGTFTDEQKEMLAGILPHIGMVKVGLRAVYSRHENGSVAEAVRDFAHERGKKVFLDCKLHDIPNTLGDAAHAVSSAGYDMFNFHASAGRAGIKAAVENKGNSVLLGVTMLTSLTDADMQEIYKARSEEKALQFARLLARSGADGLVCSPQELGILNADEETKPLLKVVPGIRPEWAEANDQARTMTPKGALAAGADYLVIGRPIRHPPQEIGTPLDAVKKIVEEIS